MLKEYLGPSGAKRIRLQVDCAKCEKVKVNTTLGGWMVLLMVRCRKVSLNKANLVQEPAKGV